MRTRLFNENIMSTRTYRIGRDSGNDIRYTSPEVSNEHAEIVCDNGIYTLIDHSKNGTLVNGNFIRNTSCRVSPGDHIVFAGKERLDWGLIGGGRRSATAPVSAVNVAQGGEKNAPYSVASMVCGITSLVLSVSPVVSLALAIVGLALGVSGTRKIKGNEHLYKGVGMLKAGKICSIITLGCIGLVLIIGLSLGMGFLFSLGDFL